MFCHVLTHCLWFKFCIRSLIWITNGQNFFVQKYLCFILLRGYPNICGWETDEKLQFYWCFALQVFEPVTWLKAMNYTDRETGECWEVGQKTWIYFNNNYSLYLYSTFLSLQSALHCQGVSPHTPPVCSIHLDDATASIVRPNAHHTPAYWWRGARVMNQQIWGLLRGHDGQRPMGEFGQDAGVTPILLSKDILGFLMTTESQNLGLTILLTV